MTELIANLSTSTWLSLITIIILSSFLMMLFIVNGFSIKFKALSEKNDNLILNEIKDKKKFEKLTQEHQILKKEQEEKRAYMEELERIKIAYESKQEEFFKTEQKLREVQEEFEMLSSDLTDLREEHLSLQKDYKRILKRNEELIAKSKN